MKPLAIIAAAALLLTGCAATPQPAVTVTVTAPAPEPTPLLPPQDAERPPASELRNPVDMLKKIDGCELEEGASAGDVDIFGNRYATCYCMDNAGTRGTALDVRIYPGDPKDWDTVNDLGASTDSSKLILGEDFAAWVVGDWSAYSKHLTKDRLEEIATTLGGRLVA